MRHLRWLLLPAAILSLTPAASRAHTDAHPGGGGVAGFLRPISGLEHVLAMVAVGLWGFELRPPLWLTALIVAALAVFHGHAHGTELPAGSKALLHSLTFVMATGLLHLLGILLGDTRRWPGGRRFVQGAGGCLALLLAISAVAVLVLRCLRSKRSPQLGACASLVAAAVAVHAMLHGMEAPVTAPQCSGGWLPSPVRCW